MLSIPSRSAASRASAGQGPAQAAGSDNPTSALDEHVVAVTTAFAARRNTAATDNTSADASTVSSNSLPAEFIDEEHEFYSHGSWMFGGY